MTAVVDHVSRVLEVAEKIRNDETQSFSEGAATGDAIRQGDIFVMKLDCVPTKCKRTAKPSAQLAPGNTQGSRHVIKSMRGVKMYSLPEPNEYDGPIVESKKPIEIDHPEHGNWILPAGVYAVWYQRTEDSEGRIRRVQD